MCIGAPSISVPPAPTVPQRQTPKAPNQVATDLQDTADRRRRGYAAMMFAGNTGRPSTSGGPVSVTGA